MSNTPETDAAWQADKDTVFRVETSRKLERERDEARAVAGAMADIAFKHLTSLLASTPHSKDAAHDKETQEVIAAIKQWKEMKR